MKILKKFYKSLPQEPGVYLFLDKKDRVLYVGKARNLKNRVSSYFINKDLGPKTSLLVSRIEKIDFTQVATEIESLLLEAAFIKKHTPQFNVKMTDGKSYPLIKITVKDKYPKVLVTRQIDDHPAAAGSLYFGPFPNPTSLRLVLKIARRIFPFQAVLNHAKRICLYNHLGLCPCPPVFDSSELKKSYSKNIKYLIRFLEGDARSVIKDLEKERDYLSKKEEFENAQKIQKQIDAINLIINPVKKPFEYDTNPNLLSDIRATELKELKNTLKDAGIKNSSLGRIECFDISNISGKLATGSMVVFINGEKDTSLYRRFKINPLTVGPNDFAMMEEVLQRRIRHLTDWGVPDLIIVDGGKGQISSAVKALKENKLMIPVIGLAKREEIIITSGFKFIRLPKDSNGLKLLMRIRDEAHRFAITYHKKLRSRLFL